MEVAQQHTPECTACSGSGRRKVLRRVCCSIPRAARVAWPDLAALRYSFMDTLGRDESVTPGASGVVNVSKLRCPCPASTLPATTTSAHTIAQGTDSLERRIVCPKQPVC
jgi:hypothetical protein